MVFRGKRRGDQEDSIRKLHVVLKGILILFVITVIGSLMFDFNIRDCKTNLYKCVREYLHYNESDLLTSLIRLKRIIVSNMSNISKITETFISILMAAVVMCYSIMDNRKDGIPHRIIIASTFGSYAVAVFFAFSLFLMFGVYIADIVGLHCFELIAIFWICFFTCLNVGIIFMSASMTFCIHVICVSAWKQYKSKVKSNSPEDLSEQYKRVFYNNYFEIMCASNEIFSDKLRLFSRLLRAPIRKRGVYKKDKVKFKYLRKSSLQTIYQYYYIDLAVALTKIKEENNSIELRAKIYEVIYFFVQMLWDKYEKQREKDICKKDLLMVTSSIMNAISSSGLSEAESACIHIVENCISKSCREETVKLYLLYQFFLFHTGIQKCGLQKMDFWKKNYIKMKKEERLFYYDFWNTWIEESSIPKERGKRYFVQAVYALTNNTYDWESKPFFYWYINLGQRGENQGCI